MQREDHQSRWKRAIHGFVQTAGMHLRMQGNVAVTCACVNEQAASKRFSFLIRNMYSSTRDTYNM